MTAGVSEDLSWHCRPAGGGSVSSSCLLQGVQDDVGSTGAPCLIEGGVFCAKLEDCARLSTT